MFALHRPSAFALLIRNVIFALNVCVVFSAHLVGGEGVDDPHIAILPSSAAPIVSPDHLFIAPSPAAVNGESAVSGSDG